MSVKERVDAHRNRDTLARKKKPASGAAAQKAYRERCRARPPPVCAYPGKSCLELEKELRKGHLPLPLDLLGPPGRLCGVCRKKKDALVCHRRCLNCKDRGDRRSQGQVVLDRRCHCGGGNVKISCIETLLSSKPLFYRLCPLCRQRLETATSFPNEPLSSEAELKLASKMSQCRNCKKFQPASDPEYPDYCGSKGCNTRRTDFGKQAQNALQRLTAAKAQMPSDQVGANELPMVPWWFEPCFNFEHETSVTDPAKCRCGRDLTVEGIRVRNAFRAPKECANPKCQVSAEEAAARPHSKLAPCEKCGKVYYCAPYYQHAFHSSCMSDHRAAHAPNCFVAKCTANLDDLNIAFG